MVCMRDGENTISTYCTMANEDVSAEEMENSTITPPWLPNPPSSGDQPLMSVNIIIIIIIFCMVCLLLLVAFFYTFCFHSTLQPTPKDHSKGMSVTVDREDVTIRRTSSSVTLENAV